MAKNYNKFDRSVHPPYLYPDYKSTSKRAPLKPLVSIGQTKSELTGPKFANYRLGEHDNNLTKSGRVNGEPIGERIIVHGYVYNENGETVPNTIIELWQANACGRYVHKVDQHDAPLDPNFLGAGRCITDENGYYKFYTIKPGAYPWGNHHNAWRPNHIHFSLFGDNIMTRLVTQMYFPGDPLLELDPIFKSVSEEARHLLISKFDIGITEPDFALGYRFDFVLRGHNATPFENQ
jgi:protocatechuate 3,4-dioxygenase, beta subunit